MKTIVIYDDSGRKSEVITDIIGDKGFGEVVVKKRRLEDYYKDELEILYQDIVWIRVRSIFEYSELINNLERYKGTDVKVVHCFSNFLISDKETARLSFKKLEYIDTDYALIHEKTAVAAMFASVESYLLFCKSITLGNKAWDLIKTMPNNFNISGVVDIGKIGNFIQCITGNFDSRYFNSLQGNDYTLVKTSTNKKKIKAEYTFYHLLPDDMKIWFVMPYDYQEDQSKASYKMERLHMTDLAIKWVHGSISETEFEELLDTYFYFFKSRHTKKCTIEEFNKEANTLYIDKLDQRINDLKNLTEFKKINLLLNAVDGASIDELVQKYYLLKNKIENRNKYKQQLVIGHGDPCFANLLYNKSTKTFKLIDPKGAIEEKNLWTNEYYDVAKLSHSICGRYDFFNNALFEIKINNNFGYDLTIPFDNSKYIEIFKRKVEENGFDYLTVRIYEVSLFLSMLPLHIDNPHKVFGFILNAKNMLEEIERYV